jgi:hypothetical protein
MDRIKNLWGSVLTQAIEDLTLKKNPSKVAIMNRDSAIDWFNSENDGVGSFKWVCIVLDFNKDKIKNELNLVRK